MRLRVLWLGLVAAGFAAGGPSRAADKPYAFFSKSSALPSDGAPANDVKIYNLYLRPNVDQAAYLYVHNPDDRKRTLTVLLWQGKKTAKAGVIARGKVEVEKKKTARVALTSPSPVKPAVPAAAAPAAGEKAAPAPATPAGLKLPPADTNLTLQVVDESEPEAERLQFEQDVGIDVRTPNELFKTPRPTVPKPNSIAVELELDREKVPSFSNAPVKVKLDLRPDLNPGLTAEPNAGTYEAELPVEGNGKVQLFAEGLKYDGADTPPQGKSYLVSVTVDGVDRAYIIKTNFGTITAPALLDEKSPFVNVKPAVTKLVPGKPLPVQFEFANITDPTGASAELWLDPRNRQPGATEFKESEANLVAKHKGLQKKEVYIQFGGAEDAIGLTTVLTDWTYELPTANVFGVRTFKLRALPAAGGPIPARDNDALAEQNVYNVRPVVIDRTPPVVTRLTLPKVSFLTSNKVSLAAEITEDWTEISEVLFYIGEPPAAGAKLVPGKLVRGKLVNTAGQPLPKAMGIGERKKLFEAVLTLPDQRGPIQIGVKAVNEVGLASRDDENTSFYIVDVLPPPPGKEKDKERTTGTIKGRVMQGSRAQPGLPVDLWDAEAKKRIKSTKSDDNGEFKFEDLPPGPYIVSSIKKVDSAKGKDDVSVEVGKTSTALINVLR